MLAPMIMKHYEHVPPSIYAGAPEGIEMREMITAQDGAPNFTLRVFDIHPGASTPFHSHEWEHEVFILDGAGTVRTEGNEMSFEKGASVFLAPHEKHCFVADRGTPVRFICVIPSSNRCRM
ncbi:MAG: cupin domain-containing protein [Nitrospirae bacterium]|nr:cupin domain-containing protein [Nitrospirota bacterium]